MKKQVSLGPVSFTGLAAMFAAIPMMATFAAPAAQAKPWITSADGVEVNWANLTARFEGAATSSPSLRDGLKGLERTAWRNGYEKAVPVLDRILRDQYAALGMQGQWQESGDEALANSRDQVKKSVKSLNATFFSSGSIEVSMEATLQAGFANALKRAGAGGGAGGQAGATGGLVLNLPASAGSSIQPSIAFWVVDSSDKVLFEPGKASGTALAKGSMGRWFRGAESQELPVIVGENPESIKVTEIRKGNRLVVDPSQFAALREDTLRALAGGRVALVVR